MTKSQQKGTLQVHEGQDPHVKYTPADKLTCGMCGETKDIEVDPHRGTHLLINGFIKAGKAKKQP